MVEKSSKSSGSGATGVVASRLNLIDLAGVKLRHDLITNFLISLP
jgi:hypothetical protein